MSTASTPPPPAEEALRPIAHPRAWQAGWVLAQAALAGAALVIGGSAAVRVAAALGIVAAPGLVGALRPRQHGRAPPMLLLLWTAAAAAAISVSGGASGPLGVYALVPAAAAALLGARWSTAVALGAAAGAFAAVVQLGGRTTAGDPGVLAVAAGGSLVLMTVAGALACARVAEGSAVRRVEAEPSPDAPRSIAPVRADQALEARVQAAERARDEAEALSHGRARVLANMSHELRTPLNAIMGFSDIMRTRLFGPLPERYGEYAELIHESGGHLVELINDVLDLSKIDAGRYELRREVFDAREPIEGALRLMRVQAQEAGVELRAALPTVPVEIDADRRAIKQIVLNLVSNALKFTPPGGTATVSLAAADGGEIVLQVVDTGHGIAAEDIERLGRPFEQTDAGRRTRGSGLGLSLVRGFAQLHGGEMTVQSRLGHGSTIGVRLPVRRRSADPLSGAPVAGDLVSGEQKGAAGGEVAGFE